MNIYLDHNASSPLHPEVLDAMLPFLRNPAANPSSLHSAGRMARSAIDTARGQVAELLGCDSGAVIFTSGGTESNNMLLKGFTDVAAGRPVVSSKIEHSAVLEPLKQLQRDGCEVILLDSDSDGVIDLDAARAALGEADPQLMSIIMANNETGAIQPFEALFELADRERCLMHSDATQAIGKLAIDMRRQRIDALSFSGHKLRGPQGVGALVVERKPKNLLISGGEQENRRRGGTENVAGIVGLGKAAEIAGLEIEHKQHYLQKLRDSFETQLDQIPGSVIFGRNAPRLPNTTFFALPYYHGETLLMELDRSGFALSSGSACHSAVTEPSHVLKAMGVDDNLALNAIRVSFGMDNSMQDADALAARLRQLVDSLPAVIRQAAG